MTEHPVLYFDGICNLCNRTVQFVLKRDRHKRFRFATLQSTAGTNVVTLGSQPGTSPGSVILYYGGKYYYKSAAALKTAQLLGGIWSLFYVFMIVPRFIRDAVYDTVARNRYKWFGRRQSCMVPTPDVAERFILS
ncbi:MAG: DUF393 domain-containing protein [Taibaiella sp.]|nr:DUF393 domain-containing protein [Taibaiella sp.]